MAATTNTAMTDRLGKSGGWVIVWGVLLIIAGIFAIVVPGPAALASVLLLAWLLVFAGVVQLFYAWQQRSEKGFWWKLISGLATLVLGGSMLMFPVAGIASLALLIGAFLFASGVSSVILAFNLRPQTGWGWVLFDGLLSIVIGVLIAVGWPGNSIVLVGVLVGICLISGGIWRIMLGRVMRAASAAAES